MRYYVSNNIEVTKMKSYKTLLIFLVALEVVVDVFLIFRVGLIKTILIFAITGVIGFLIMKKTGSGLTQTAMTKMMTNPQSGNELLDKLCVIFAGLLLIIPGFVSDILALALLFKPTRKMLNPFIMGLLFKIAQNVDQSMLQKAASGGYSRK